MEHATIEQIARVCHEANRAFCESIGDGSQRPWCDAEEWQRSSAILGVKAQWEALVRGERPDARSSRENWVLTKRAAGWKFGPVKNSERKEHPGLIAYEQLATNEKLKDQLFYGVVQAFYDAANA